jgi:hypothetical protein
MILVDRPQLLGWVLNRYPHLDVIEDAHWIEVTDGRCTMRYRRSGQLIGIRYYRPGAEPRDMPSRVGRVPTTPAEDLRSAWFWGKDEPRSPYPCPRCGAGPGERCVAPSGKPKGWGVHATRRPTMRQFAEGLLRNLP